MKINNKVIHHSNNIIKEEYILFIHSNTISFIYLYIYIKHVILNFIITTLYIIT